MPIVGQWIDVMFNYRTTQRVNKFLMKLAFKSPYINDRVNGIKYYMLNLQP